MGITCWQCDKYTINTLSVHAETVWWWRHTDSADLDPDIRGTTDSTGDFKLKGVSTFQLGKPLFFY